PRRRAAAILPHPDAMRRRPGPAGSRTGDGTAARPPIVGIDGRAVRAGVRSEVGEPEGDLPGRGLLRVRAVDQVELGLEAVVATDRAGGRLLDGVGPPGELAPRRDRAGTLGDPGDDRAGGDEL